MQCIATYRRTSFKHVFGQQCERIATHDKYCHFHKNTPDEPFTIHGQDYDNVNIPKIYRIWYEGIDVCYIGKTERPLRERMIKHVHVAQGDMNTEVSKWIAKTGYDFNVTLIATVPNKADVFDVERLCISQNLPNINMIDKGLPTCGGTRSNGKPCNKKTALINGRCKHHNES